MAVITPIRSDFAQLDARLLLSRPRAVTEFQPARLARFAALLVADICAFVLAFGSAVLLAGLVTPDIMSVASVQDMLIGNGLLGAGVVLYFAQRGHYARRLPFGSVLGNAAAASAAAMLCAGFVQFSLQAHGLAPRGLAYFAAWLLLALSWALFPPGVMLTRLFARRALAQAGVWNLRAVVIGTGPAAAQAAAALLSEPSLGYAIAGIVSPTSLKRSHGALWRGVLRRHRAELLVLALDPQDPAASAITRSLVCERVPFAVVPHFEHLPVVGFEQACFPSHNTVMLTYNTNATRPLARAIKLAFDVAVATVMLIVAAPTFLLIAAAIKRDGGPVFYAHRRVGAHGREFGCLKFRSMVVDGDSVLKRVLAHDPQAAAEWAQTQKLKNDPRVTRIGRFLRATSLDELPQLINVLRLEMSLVGPRPIVRAEVARYGEEIAYYYKARPGVTGLWQVSGRSNTGYSQRVRLDAWYVKNWTLMRDVAILAKTVPAVLARRGAV